MKQDNTEAATIKATETAANSNEKETMTTRIDANVVHHQKVEPVVAHAQAHDFSHNQAVSAKFQYYDNYQDMWWGKN